MNSAVNTIIYSPDRLTAHRPHRLITAEPTNTQEANDPTDFVLYEKKDVSAAAPVSGPSKG
jgi:hypothetical protein